MMKKWVCISKYFFFFLSLHQFSTVQLLSLTLCEPIYCSILCPSPNYWSLLKLISICQWCHPAISSSVVPFSHLHFFPGSGPFPINQFFPSGGQSIGVSALASVLPMNIQDWFPLGLTGWISVLSKGLSRVFFNTIVQKHQFFSAQLSLWSNSPIQTWLLEKP